MENAFKVKKGLIVQASGSTAVDIQGNSGQLFSITDSLTGVLMSVNDISGLPILEVSDNDQIKMGTFGNEAIIVTGSTANITGSLFGTASWANNAVTSNTATQTSQAVTFNNGGSGAASGTTFNGSTAITVSHNTIGAVPTGRTLTGGDGIQTIGNLTADRTIAVDSTVIRTTGNQTLGGTKTFSSAVVLSTAGTATNHAVRADRTITIGGSSAKNLTSNVSFTLTEIGAQAALTNPITGTGTSGQVSFFNGTTTQTGDNGLFWDNTNKRLGIGTTNPQARLDVGVGSSSAPTYKGSIRLLSGTTTSDGGLEFFSSDFGSGFGWRLTPIDIGAGETPLVFYSRQNIATWTERVRITSAGLVGIGTTSPSEKLHVVGRARITTIDNGTGDFATISSTGVITRRTAAQVLSDIGCCLSGTQYLFVRANSTDIENATELQAAYDLAVTMSPSDTNRITVIAAPGNYNFDSSNFVMDEEYIDLVSLDGNRSIIFNGDGTIIISANDVFVKGVNTLTKSFIIGDDLKIKVENCKGGDESFGDRRRTPGTFINCEGGDFSFGFREETSGTFNNCVGGDFSFGAQGDASGTFTKCIGGDSSFGAGGTLNGKLYYCRLTSGTFQTVSGGGRTYYCVDGNGDPDNQ